ncbi:ABC transporter substrate-binding protein [Rhodoligotrophos ferricapiens]|uniref:ABC transporter substrate-binding protein n=1 Tax=Rhodoligotrophos ferricapiens TaxID=3069264 RepID=UPI00315CE7A0
MIKTKRGVSRRNFLKGAAGAAAAGAVGTTITGFPHIAGAQAKTIRIGMPTILSGRVAILGTSSRSAVQLAVQQFNEAGGLNGRTIEVIYRDSKGRPDEAAKVTRDLINNDGCEIIIDGEASSGSFAVQEVIRELPVLCLHTCSESSTLTADPKLHVKTAFRSARQGVHDAVAGGRYASELSKQKGLKRWMTCSPDYAYGRDNTAEFLEYAKKFDPSIEVLDQVWPKLFQPDYTENITKILQVQPQAMYSALWGGDLVAFIEQGNLYGLFNNITYFSGGLGDPPVLTAIKQLPVGLHTVYRYNELYPNNPENAAFAAGYKKLANQEPTNWSWQNYLATSFIFEALKRTNGNTEGAALAAEVKGMEIASPFAVEGKITMRDSDHTIIGYPAAWGVTVPKFPYVENFQSVPWSEILELEAEWKKSKGYA